MEENQHVFRIMAIVNTLNNSYTSELEKEHLEILGEESLNYIRSMSINDIVDFVESLTITEELKNNSDFTSMMSTLYYQLYAKITPIRQDFYEKSEDFLVLSARQNSPRSLFVLGNNQFLQGRSEEGLTNMIMARNLGYPDAYLFTEVYKWHIALVTSNANNYYRVEDYNEDKLKEHMIACAEGNSSFDIDTIESIEKIILKTNEAYNSTKTLHAICETVKIGTDSIKVNDLSIEEFLDSVIANSYLVINNILSKVTDSSAKYLSEEPKRLHKGIIDIERYVRLIGMKKEEMHHC